MNSNRNFKKAKSAEQNTAFAASNRFYEFITYYSCNARKINLILSPFYAVTGKCPTQYSMRMKLPAMRVMIVEVRSCEKLISC
jgi:hypothetical protein